jgi:hypothetical protein
MNADQAKFLAEHYATIIESEIPTTAKVLAAVGRGNGDYKPDPKSRSAIQLARHIATADGWFVQSVLDGKFEFDQAAAEKAEESLTTADDAVAFYEKSMRDKIHQLRTTPADKLAREVDFFGFMQAPAVTFLAMAQNHTCAPWDRTYRPSTAAARTNPCRLRLQARDRGPGIGDQERWSLIPDPRPPIPHVSRSPHLHRSPPP